MTVFAFIITGLILLTLQTTVLMPEPLWYGSPDLCFILTAYLAYRMNYLAGTLIILPVSWFCDVFCGTVLGTYPVIYLFSFVLLKYISQHMPVRESFYQLPLIGAVHLIIHRLVYFGLGFIEPNPLPPWSWTFILIKVLIMVLLAFPLLRFLDAIARYMEKFTHHSGDLLHIRSGNRFR
ncbi:MAG: hypothetical protein OEV64_10815 [Desulfobulbaceae bacterium]|nr:hypothetical protein [Desulfobulbaceae bacterium]